MPFHLRPVSESPSSPSPTASTTPPSHSPSSKGPSTVLPSQMASNQANGRPRRPLSPSSLRDVDLNHTPDMPQRKYAAPLTGHDLMAMFPPAAPEISPEMRAGPTSGYFQRQERAFFAQAGREIVRVRVEVDIQNGADAENMPSKTRGRDSSRPWPHLGHGPHHSPVQSSSAPVLYPHPPNSRPSPRGIAPVTSAPLYPIPSHSPSSQHPPNLHPPALRTPPHDNAQPGAPKSEFQADEYDPDEAWRRPMPYAERRRAGKHTRRVIVRT
ncbi:hypothetical protein D9615_007894 [Tricholomella constricta]|uniref:Uncharacterized protein n=1 Tax=Tricholomella constricta TaxID=117010 RepID=A0A8H5M0W2_9AGAR|nr:hypothetical protein D9615_007894 [Tricholomella constricta]